MISTKLKEYLDDAGIPYRRRVHPTAYTSQEIAAAIHVPGRQVVKSVIVKADEGALAMAVLSANDTADLDALRKEIGCGTLRLATEKEFSDAFPTCSIGAMPPLGNIFGLPTYCETSLSRNREIEFNAGTHEETIRMAFDDFERLANPKMVRLARARSGHPERMAA
jgi:Ala-tRNA(Pro) deacylase